MKLWFRSKHETSLQFWEKGAANNPFHVVCESANALDNLPTDNVLFHSGVNYKGKVVLDLCCGIGRVANLISKDVASYVGVDWSKTMIAQARSIHKDKPNVIFAVNNGKDLSGLPNKMFDVVFCELAFQHMKKKTTKRYVDEVLRVLKPNGVFVAQLPRKDYYDSFQESKGRGFSFQEASQLFSKYKKTEFFNDYKHGYAYFLVEATSGQQTQTIVGQGTEIFGGAILESTDKLPIVLGKNCTVHEYCVLYGNLKIGDNVRIAAHTIIVPLRHTFKQKDIPIWQQPSESKGVVIEDDVWVGANCTILDGAKIGSGSIIGAGSVVTYDTVIPSYSIAYGNPCKVMRGRFDS